MNVENKINPLIRILNSNENSFDNELERLLSFDSGQSKILFEKVETILNSVKKNGDKALIEYSSKFDNYTVSSISELEVPKETLKDAYSSISFSERSALNTAAFFVLDPAGPGISASKNLLSPTLKIPK